MLRQIARTVAIGVGGYLVARHFSQKENGRLLGNDATNSELRSIVEMIEVDVPVERAYNQWTQFEDFPQFMSGVESIRQVDDKTLHWTVLVAGQRQEWDAEITEQLPDERIAWHSISGAQNAGVVTFHRLSDSRSRVTLQLDYEPRTAKERIGDTLLHAVQNEAKVSLQGFKTFIEAHGETGAWRESITRR